jgi:hypothetical protein
MKNVTTTNKIALAVASIALIFAAKLAYDANEKLQQLEKNSAGFDLQLKCSTAAKKLINNLGWRGDEALFAAENHYSNKLNKCFVLLTNGDFVGAGKNGKFFRTGTVIDAVEEKQFGEFFGRYTVTDVMNDDAAVDRCSVKLLDGTDAKCSTVGEFKKLAATYMSD